MKDGKSGGDVPGKIAGKGGFRFGLIEKKEVRRR